MTKQIVVEIETATQVVSVQKEGEVYEVWSDGVLRHPGCDADGALRALGTYLHSALYKLDKAVAA